MSGDFETGTPSFNPWGGVDLAGNLHVWEGAQLAVNDIGEIKRQSFSPSVAVGDLNGDGLLDLVVADARGYFWFFPNSGTAQTPAFTHGEVMPIWLDDDYRHGDVVPRIQLIDFTGEKKLSLVAGNYAGQLYFLRNQGSASSPDFRMPADRASIQIPTHSDGSLWCNYLAPFLFDWSGSGRLDLVMGDGSYCANSIFMLTNQGSNDRPLFKEEQTEKIIPGMGREHLTPQVVDWNNDGKPDIISGERTGQIDVYLNQAATKSDAPVFDMANPLHVMFGKLDKIGAFTTVCVADLNNDKLFALIVSSTDGRILYARNTGTAGAPKFETPVPLKGVNPYPKIILPRNWEIHRLLPYGAAYELLECVDAQSEPGFTPPPNFMGKHAMKFSIVNPQVTCFKELYVPEDNMRRIRYTGGVIRLQTENDYTISFWVRSEGAIANLAWHLEASQPNADGQPGQGIKNAYVGQVEAGRTWNQFSDQVSIISKTDKRQVILGFNLGLTWDGDGSVFFDDFQLNKVN